MTFLDFSIIAGQITEWISLGLFLLLIYYGWLIIKDPAKTAAEFGLEGGSKLGGWLKGKGAVPFTKEHRDKYGNYAISKRAFKLEMDGYTRDQAELKQMGKVQQFVNELSSKKTRLERATRGSTSIKNYEDFHQEVKAAHTAIKRETKDFKKIGKWYRRRWPEHMRKMAEVLKNLEDNKDVSPETINQIKILEKNVMVKHEETKNKVLELQALVDELFKVSEEAATVPRGNISASKEILVNFDFSLAPKLARDTVNLQNAAVRDLKGLIAATQKVM